MAVIHNKPAKQFVEDRVGVFHPNLLIGLFEGNRDEVKESIVEHCVHDDEVMLLFQGHSMGELDVGLVVGVGASGVIGDIINFIGERVIVIRVCFSA